MSDGLGDRMKMYEGVESDRRFLPMLPVIARLDGKGFSKFTKGFERPYDKRMSDAMIKTTRYLVEETNANCGYCQSDEITLGFYSSDWKSQIWFDGRIQKMASVLAAKCSVYFNLAIENEIQCSSDKMPVFDCRVWQLPTLEEATNTFLWRELDATKNSISMAASHYYSHTELMNKCGSDKQEMLHKVGINWNDYPAFFKRGTYLQRKKFSRKLTVEELEDLPPMHHARKNPDIIVERGQVVSLDIPPLTKVINRSDVIFFGAEPITEAN